MNNKIKNDFIFIDKDNNKWYQVFGYWVCCNKKCNNR